MAWTLLIVAGLLEVGWAVGLKTTDGFTRLWPSVITIAVMIVSITMLNLAVRTIPIGTGYAVWTGIGIVGTVLVGIMLLGEPASLPRIVFLTMILVGIVGLKWVSGPEAPARPIKPPPVGLTDAESPPEPVAQARSSGAPETPASPEASGTPERSATLQATVSPSPAASAINCS